MKSSVCSQLDYNERHLRLLKYHCVPQGACSKGATCECFGGESMAEGRNVSGTFQEAGALAEKRSEKGSVCSREPFLCKTV